MFKLCKAELKKIFLRPAVYVMLFAIAAVLVVAAFLYQPLERNNPTTKFGGAGQTISMAFSAFNTSDSVDGKLALDEKLENQRQKMLSFGEQASIKGQLLENLEFIEYSLTHNDESKQTMGWALFNYAALQTEANQNALIDAIQVLAARADEVNKLCVGVNFENIDFYITDEALSGVQEYAQRLYLTIPSEEDFISRSQTESNFREWLKDFADNLKQNYVPTAEIACLEGVTDIELTAEEISALEEKFYAPVAFSAGGVTADIYATLETFVAENSDDVTADKRAEFNALTTQYKLAIEAASQGLASGFFLEKAGGYTDAAVKNFIGFEQFNSYLLTEDVTRANYIIENNLFTADTLENFGFLTTSGYQVSAYDFAFFAMQILSIVLVIFAVYFMSTSMAGDHQNGTIKMIASRPITRTQIVGGKALGAILFALVFSVFSIVASLACGYALYGWGSGEILAVFNATTAFMMHPALMLAIYFVSMFLGLMFFIVLANFLAVIFRTSLGAFFGTLIVYVAFLVLSATAMGSAWIIFTPFAYLCPFAFMGGAGAISSFGAITMPVGINAWIGLGVLAGMLVLLDLLAKLIFKRRDIA